MSDDPARHRTGPEVPVAGHTDTDTDTAADGAEAAAGWQVERAEGVLRLWWPGGRVELTFTSIVEVVPRIGRRSTELDFALAAPAGGRLRVNMDASPDAGHLDRLLAALQDTRADRDGAAPVADPAPRPAAPPSAGAVVATAPVPARAAAAAPAVPPAPPAAPAPIRGPALVADNDDWLILDPLPDTGLLARGELLRPPGIADGEHRG